MKGTRTMKKKLIVTVLAILLTIGTMIPSTTSKAYNYTVGYGESYFDLGSQLGVNYPDLMNWNGASSDLLIPGQQIWIPDECLEPGFNAPYSQEYYNSYSTEYYEEPTYYEDYSYVEPTYYNESSNYEGSSCSYEEPIYYEEPYNYESNSSNNYEEAESIDYAYGTSSLSTSYYGNVAWNVGLACEYNDGVIIQPGDTYSAFDVLGDGGYAEGFKASPGLGSGGEVVTMPGSGICTVETMIWQAMRDAGMVAVERHEHNYGESGGKCWYAEDPGNQAMFNAGTSDLKVNNPYDYAMKLNASYVDGEIKITCEAVK